MDHVAIMKKSWGFLPKILSGEKTIESRWYLSKRTPWNRVSKGDSLYFKNSGELIKTKGLVSKVIQFENLNPNKIKSILNKYGKRGLGIDNIPKFYKLIKHKKYCILIFVKSPKTIKPFSIDKKGFGAMTAWITVEDIKTVSS